MGTNFYRRLFLLPGLLLLIAIIIFPLLFSIRVSMSSWNVSRSGLDFVGAANWERMLSDSDFWSSMARLLNFAVLTTLFQYVLGFMLAFYAWQGIRGGRFFRLVWLLPLMTTPSIMAIVWRSVFREDIGAANGILRALGISPVSWSTEIGPATFSIYVAEIWQWTPFMFLFLLAGLLVLPKEPFLAAEIDGASASRTFWKITFPLMAPISIGAILIRLIESSKIFDSIFVLTSAGPGNATETPTYFLWKRSLTEFQIAYGATLALTYLVVMIIVLTVVAKVLSYFARPKGW
ncbi:MAG: sugar ABC transporter permease [Nocardioides sp.]